MAYKVSCILPSHNSKEKWLNKSVESVLSQTYENIELIIVDDGSETPAKEKIGQKLLEDERLSIHRQENQGFTAATNAAIEKSEGDLIAPIGDDDIWMEERIEKGVKNIQEGCDLVFSAGIIIDKEGRKIEKGCNMCGIGTEALFESGICYESALFDKNVFDKYGKLNEDFEIASDTELWMRIWNRVEICFIDEPLIKKRRHEKNLGSSDDAIEEIEEIYEMYLDSYLNRSERRTQWSQLYKGSAWAAAEKGDLVKARELWKRSVAKNSFDYKSLGLLITSISPSILKHVTKWKN